jgi:hypothetical protein
MYWVLGSERERLFILFNGSDFFFLPQLIEEILKKKMENHEINESSN